MSSCHSSPLSLPTTTVYDEYEYADQTMSEGQNLAGRRLAVVALSAIKLPIIKHHIPAIVAAIDNATPGPFQAVDCGIVSRKRANEE